MGKQPAQSSPVERRMNFSENRILATVLALAVAIGSLIAVPVAAKLGLLVLYIEPNPRHMPPDLMGEAVGWAVIGLLTGIFVVVIAESVIWSLGTGVWDRYRGLILGAIVSLIIGCSLGVSFAIVQMDSVDGQGMTSMKLAVLAGGITSTLGTFAGITAGTVLRRYVLALYRLPGSGDSIMRHANGAVQPAPEGSGHAGKYP